MQVTNVNLILATNTPQDTDGPNPRDKVLAYCSLTFDECFVIHNVRLIQGKDKIIICMPYNKCADKCPQCSTKCDLTDVMCDFSDVYCRRCGTKLSPVKDRIEAIQTRFGRKTRLFYDLCHPINRQTRNDIENAILDAYKDRVEAHEAKAAAANNE